MRKCLFFLLTLFTIITGFYFWLSWSELPEGHRFIYPLDDVYIHLALARHFAENGVWSINDHGFDSASSSILYTLLLGFFIKVFGDWEFYPIIINLAFGYLTVYAVYWYFKDFYTETEMKWGLVLLLPFSLLYMMVIIGMENTMHMFFTVLAVYFIHKNVISNFAKGDFIKLLIVIFLISITRFESMFFTASLAFALLLRKSFIKSFWVLFIGFLPLVIFGLISVKNGGFFFPNSVMVKGVYPGGTGLIASVWLILKEGLILNTSFYKCLFFPFVILLAYLIRKYKDRGFWEMMKNETLIITVVSTGILHSLFAMLKYRYENYIMIAVLLLIIPVISHFFKNVKFHKAFFNSYNVLVFGSALMVFAVSLYRFGYHHEYLKYSGKGINEQQIEMSRFLAKYYKGEKVMANDIGAISYFSHVQLLDIVGLGSTEVANLKVDNKHVDRKTYERNYKSFIYQYSKENKYNIGVIYPQWFPGRPPANWIPVASWKIQGHYGPAIDRVVWYSLNKKDAERLRQNLQKFDLNRNVIQYYYIYK